MNSTAITALTMIAGLLGGLTFFLFGMNTMSSGLEQMAGGSLEKTMKKFTKNVFSGFFLGAGITIAIQSSSAMTVMLVGLVNSGIMNFSDTFGIIMGSNVGTTLTAWITTLGGIKGDGNIILTLLQPTSFAPILAFVGIVFRMLSKSEKKKNIGLIFIGFAILMAGMTMMSQAVSSVKDSQSFKDMLTAFESPALALLASALFTGIIQSSAATVVIVQSLALNGAVSYQIAIPLILGANIGTCMTALISCIGTNKDAKRVVAMHLYTNTLGGFLCVIIMYIIMAFSPDFLASHYVGVIGVAAIHSLFNISITVLFTPFKNAMIRLCERTVKKDVDKLHTVFLDERIFNNTPLAISECRRLTIEMAEYSRKALITSIGLIDNYNEKDVQFVRDTETLTDKYEDKLSTYLVRLSSSELSASDSHAVARMLHSIGDFERIADHALNIRDAAQEIMDKKIIFSEGARNELKVITGALLEILNLAIDAFVKDDVELASHVEPLEQVIDKLKNELKARHVERLQHGECTVQLGFVFSDILTNYERVSDHCSNVAVYTLQINSAKLDTHKYLNNVKSEKVGEYADEYNMYDKKYHLN